MTINIKKIIKRIKFRPLLIWRVGLVAFLVFVVILFILNVRFLLMTDRELNYFKEGGTQFEPRTINRALLESIILEVENREEVFNKGLLEKPEIKDPSI